jgi:ribosome-associated protein
MSDDLHVGRSLTIPARELDYTFTTSGGPGGQHANRSSTKATVTWNVDNSEAIGERRRQLLRTNLRNRIDAAGNLRLSSDRHRSQLRNRDEVRTRLAHLIEQALQPRKQRVATKATKAARERRLQEKRKRSDVKKQRRSPSVEH